MFRFESIPTNNERSVPLVVRKRRERKKLSKDDIPFGLKLFSCLLRCSLLAYRSGHAAFFAPLMLNKIVSAIVTVFMNQITIVPGHTTERRRALKYFDSLFNHIKCGRMRKVKAKKKVLSPKNYLLVGE